MCITINNNSLSTRYIIRVFKDKSSEIVKSINCKNCVNGDVINCLKTQLHPRHEQESTKYINIIESIKSVFTFSCSSLVDSHISD